MTAFRAERLACRSPRIAMVRGSLMLGTDPFHR
jgi:hypothetical protein